MPWYRVRLNAADIARNWHGILLSRFETFFRALKGPDDMAMYSTTMVAEIVTLYFTPATGERAPSLIRLANAEVCTRPTEEVALLAGHPGAAKIIQANKRQ